MAASTAAADYGGSGFNGSSPDTEPLALGPLKNARLAGSPERQVNKAIVPQEAGKVSSSKDTGNEMQTKDSMERESHRFSLKNLELPKETMETSFGITNIIHNVLLNPRGQVLSYDIRNLIRFGGFMSMYAKGTLFRDDYGLIMYFIVHFGALALSILVVSFAFDDYANMELDSIERLSGNLNFMVPLVLGLYLAIQLERWWTLRVKAIGLLCDCALDIVQLFGAYLPDEPETTAFVGKWSMDSVRLLMKAAGGEYDLKDMVALGQLTASEAQSLEGVALYGRAMVMWAWIARIGSEALMKCKGPEPYSIHLASILDVCVHARRAIQTIHTYLYTPLPFSYVHIVAFLVDATVSVSTLKCSLVCVKAYHQDPTNFQNISYEMVSFIALPLLYFGLMSVTYIIRDPFNGDMADFPISTFMRWHQDHLNATIDGVDTFPWQEWETLSGQPQSPEAKAKAAQDIRDAGGIPQEEVDEDSAGVNLVADLAARQIMKDATIEVTVLVSKALKGFSQELKSCIKSVEDVGEQRHMDTELLLERLAERQRNPTHHH